MRIYHKGTITAEFGMAVWLLAVILGHFHGRGYGIHESWVASLFVLGAILIGWGILWEMRAERHPVSESVLTTLCWFARFCPHAKELLEKTPHPTWAEAFHVEKLCRKEKH